MVYHYLQKENFAPFASGHVLYQRSGYPNYPVRLAGELFCRCLELTGKKDGIVLYDPCSGAGYLLTVIGFLFNKKIKSLYASDISEEAVELTGKNLSLLSPGGIDKRQRELEELASRYGKDSHAGALRSAASLRAYLTHSVETRCFAADILQSDFRQPFRPDIIMTDAPYGALSSWQQPNAGAGARYPLDAMLDSLKNVSGNHTVICLSRHKKQKPGRGPFSIVETIKTGHRVIDFLR